MSMLAWCFWIAFAVVVYTYLGYGAVLWTLVRVKARTSRTDPARSGTSDATYAPAVTLVVAAYNEAAVALDKARNSLALEYPRGMLRVVFVTDGSTDGTPDLLRRVEGIDVLHEPARRGKVAALNRAMANISTPIVVFSDANTHLNPDAIRKIVRHYQDPRVGAVAGEKRVQAPTADGAASEGLYWRYESALKRLDSELHSVVGAAGELFSMRSRLFREVESDTILDDFMLTLRVAERGMRVLYEPEAHAIEGPSAGVGEEMKRKVRICAGGFQAMVRLRGLLNPLRHGTLTFQYVSHRVLRWTLAPALLPVLLGLNAALVAVEGGVVWTTLLLLQSAFYGTALLGWTRRDEASPFPGFFVPMYFCVMNAAVFLGFLRFVRGTQSQSWERAGRATFSPSTRAPGKYPLRRRPSRLV
jgi:cellulose synthase/poly-beta-1,6-N-acetylglucosamine synthase-like glycosyltransferase